MKQSWLEKSKEQFTQQEWQQLRPCEQGNWWFGVEAWGIEQWRGVYAPVAPNQQQ